MSISSARLYGIATLALGTLSAAQDLGVPSGWRESSNKYSQAALVGNAVAGINAIMPQLTSYDAQFNGIGYWQGANVWSNLANNDHWAATTAYQSEVVTNLNTAWSLYANYDKWGFNDDALWWGSAAYYAYRAYDDSGMLANAVATWNHVSNYVITAADASAGSMSTKNFTIKGTCNGATMAGGVFWVRPDLSSSIFNLSMASPLICVAVHDSTDIDAITTFDWIKGQVLNSDYLVLDTVQANNCTTSPATELFTYNSGKAVEGLAVLAAVTGDAQWSDLCTNIVVAAVKNTVWQGANGVITEAFHSADAARICALAVLLRGLHEVYARSTNSDLKTLIHS
ncbi:hypothetical protein FIBSPDRAFT_988790 [Athelia psychrophila]|uniref:Glycoside hydrolase family 76 protein n=1 Tax=Athelia psychrophila TaxID=1759441 RepID=A0A166SIF4_9AGAM|nr:hypothetical protein FIBSPDRAFT_988790 [Fibularhizoctonia sp. CBS 109695]